MEAPSERTRLLADALDIPVARERRLSSFSNWSGIDVTHLSPVTPLLDAIRPSESPITAKQKPTTKLQATLFNSVAVLMVCASGVLGWWVSNYSVGSPRHHHHHDASKPHHDEDDVLQFSLWGQCFGYLCAVLYLGSRIPQILLNYRRKSTDGVSMLFFIFACIGNLTYVLSIFAFEGKCKGSLGHCEPGEKEALYGRYILVNASWLVGSLGTLLLDLGIFVQFFMYRPSEEEYSDEETVESIDGNDVATDIGYFSSGIIQYLERKD